MKQKQLLQTFQSSHTSLDDTRVELVVLAEDEQSLGLSICFSDDVCLCLFSERMGKVAPSVFSGVRTGTETVLDKPAATKTPGASVFSK